MYLISTQFEIGPTPIEFVVFGGAEPHQQFIRPQERFACVKSLRDCGGGFMGQMQDSSWLCHSFPLGSEARYYHVYLA